MSSQLLILIVEASIRVTVLATVVAGLLWLLRIPRGAARHSAWLVVVIAMLLMPGLQRLTPALPIAIPPQMPKLATVPLISEPAPSAPNAVAPPVALARADDSQGASPTTPPPAQPRVRAQRVDWVQIAAAIYALVAAGFLLQLIVAVRTVRAISAGARPIGDGLFESGAIVTPVTIGVFRPRVVLPVTWTEWPETTQHAVIAHERSHARRRDPLVATLARLNVSVFWFLPLSWWLERTLTDAAEQACDDVGVGAVPHPRQYAEALLAMATASQRAGGRVLWAGVSVEGRGRLSQRIERILRADRTLPTSRARVWFALVGCVAAVAAIAACQSSSEPPPPLVPLVEDLPPGVAEQRQEGERYSAIRKAATAMTWEQAAELESQWRRNPEDLATAEKLLFFYEPDVSGKQTPDDAKKIAGRRPVILWLIEHRPDSDLIRSIPGRIFPPGDWLPDQQGYDAAKKLWLAHAARPDVTAKTLRTAAAYLDVADKPIAEQLLLQGRRKHPDAMPWSAALGRLYAEAILGSNRFTLFNVVHSTSVEEARGEFASKARAALEATSDPAILSAAGRFLAMNARQAKVDFDRLAVARRYLNRTIQLDQKSQDARYARNVLDSLELGDKVARERELLAGVPGERLPEVIATLPEDMRLSVLVRRAALEYLAAESDDWRTKHPQVPGDDRPEQIERNRKDAQAEWQRSKEYAQAALDLASRLPSHPDHADALFSANITLGANAFREGDRDGAVRHMLAAAGTPPSAATRVGSPILNVSLESKLIPQLLKHGERETVIEYFERSADKRPADRERLLTAATAIKNGKLPVSTYERGAP